MLSLTFAKRRHVKKNVVSIGKIHYDLLIFVPLIYFHFVKTIGGRELRKQNFIDITEKKHRRET